MELSRAVLITGPGRDARRWTFGEPLYLLLHPCRGHADVPIELWVLGTGLLAVEQLELGWGVKAARVAEALPPGRAGRRFKSVGRKTLKHESLEGVYA